MTNKQGWVAVPVEPTEGMLTAAENETDYPEWNADIYRAMIKARPADAPVCVEKKTEAEIMEWFETKLREVCFQAPPDYCRELAKIMVKELVRHLNLVKEKGE